MNQGKIITFAIYIQESNSSKHILLTKIIGRNNLLVLPRRSILICNSLFTELFIFANRNIAECFMELKGITRSFIPVKPVRTSQLSALA